MNMGRTVDKKLAKGGGIAGDVFPENVEVTWTERGVNNLGFSGWPSGRP